MARWRLSGLNQGRRCAIRVQAAAAWQHQTQGSTLACPAHLLHGILDSEALQEAGGLGQPVAQHPRLQDLLGVEAPAGLRGQQALVVRQQILGDAVWRGEGGGRRAVLTLGFVGCRKVTHGSAALRGSRGAGAACKTAAAAKEHACRRAHPCYAGPRCAPAAPRCTLLAPGSPGPRRPPPRLAPPSLPAGVAKEKEEEAGS